MKGTLKLTHDLVRLGGFQGTCFMYNGENHLATLDGDKGVYVECVNLNGPTVVHVDPEVHIKPIDLEIKEL